MRPAAVLRAPRTGEGLIARALGDMPEAIARFRRALELNPDWVTAMANLASLYAAAPDASDRRKPPARTSVVRNRSQCVRGIGVPLCT